MTMEVEESRSASFEKSKCNPGKKRKWQAYIQSSTVPKKKKKKTNVSAGIVSDKDSSNNDSSKIADSSVMKNGSSPGGKCQNGDSAGHTQSYHIIHKSEQNSATTNVSKKKKKKKKQNKNTLSSRHNGNSDMCNGETALKNNVTNGANNNDLKVFKPGQNVSTKNVQINKHTPQIPKLNFKQLQVQRKNLPIFTAKHKLLEEIRQLPSAVLIGETGSGKTTQIPQYLYESGIHKNHMVAVTQPRRVAAMTVAQRVAQEMGTKVGEKVGYCVRFDDSTSENTKIKYMTDGMLLREAILDPMLKRYSVVILDEAHERTIHTDVLFGIAKKAQRIRRKKKMLPLKLLVMSATMDVDHFSKYFNNAPVLYVEGRQYPIKLMYSSQDQSDYIFASIVTVFQIHQDVPASEDILVFLTGQEEIESTVKAIKDISQTLPSNLPPLLVYPLYSSLPPGQQLKVFEAVPKGYRKVIISTNVAETSVTIHGIKHVVDSGMVKLKSFQPSSGLEVLKVSRVSQAQAWQRTGRAGRESPGTCYRLYTEQEFDNLGVNTIPEIQRCSLSNVVLQLMALGIRDVFNFDFMDKPKLDALKSAYDQLDLLGAVSKDENDAYQLTPCGRQMAAFPLEPCLAKVLLAAGDLNCLEEMLTVVSMMSADSVLFTPNSKREQANSVRRKFLSSDGDHLTMLNIYRSYKGVNGNKHWCHENFINQKNMKLVLEIRAQLRDICVRQDMDIKSCGRDTTNVRKCLVAGFFMNAAELQKEGSYVTVQSRKQVAIHPSSALFMCKPSLVIYNELTETNKCYIRDLSVVDAEWLFEVAPSFFKRKHFR